MLCFTWNNNDIWNYNKRIIIVYFLSNLFRIKFLNKINNKSDSILRFWLIDVRLIFVECVFAK